MMFAYIKEYYLLGLYADSDLDVFFDAGMLTEDQENEIKATKATESTSSSETTSNSASTSESTSATAATSETASN